MDVHILFITEPLLSIYLKYLPKWKWKWSCSVVSDSLRPMGCSPPSSSVHGILQARILGWVAISFSRGSSWPRDRTQVSCIAGRHFNLCTTREALKYKNTVSQKTSYRDTELQIQILTSKISREERKPGWKKKGEDGRKGWPYRCLLPPTDTQALWDFSLGLQRGRTGTWPYEKSDQTRTRIQVLCQETMISDDLHEI